MTDFVIKESNLNDLEKMKYISKKTFIETFSDVNSHQDIENYLKENFSVDKLKSEFNNTASIFYIVEHNSKVVAYMKLNFDEAQTERGHENTLEIQRIYVLKDSKNMHIGKMLMQKAIELGKSNNLNYIWLGVWEKNISAIKFYEKHNFIKFDTHIFMLGDDQQIDYLMKLSLKDHQ